MLFLIFALFLPLSVFHNTASHETNSQILKPEVNGIKWSEPEVQAKMTDFSRKEDFTSTEVFASTEALEQETIDDDELEVVNDDLAVVDDDLRLQPEVDVTTPTSIDTSSRVVKRSTGSNLAGLPWFDSCGEAMPITPRVLSSGKTLNHAAAYNNISNEYLVVFDSDRNFDNLPERLYATRRRVLCENTRAATVDAMISISIRDGKYQGWPSIAYNVHKNEYLVVYQAYHTRVSRWLIIGQRISADSNRTERAGNAFIAMSIVSNNRRLNCINPMVIYIPNTQLYVVAGEVQLSRDQYQVRVVCFNSTLKPNASSTFPFNGSVRKPHLVHDPINNRMYLIVRSIVDKRAKLLYIVLREDCTIMPSDPLDFIPTAVMISSTSVSNSRFEATFDHSTGSVVCVWSDTNEEEQRVLNSARLDGYDVTLGPGKFNSLDKNPIQRADVVYYPPFESPVVVWEEVIGGRSFLGGSMLLVGSVAMYNVARRQSDPVVIYVSDPNNKKLIVVWRQYVRYDIRIFAQCLCESPRGLPSTAQNLIVGRPGLFYWMPAQDRARLAALFTNEIPDVGTSDFNLQHNKMAWYNRTDQTIRVSDLDGQNPNTAAIDVNEPGAMAGDFSNNALFYTDPVENSVVSVRTDGNNIQNTVETDVGDPSILAVRDNRLIYSEESGGVSSTLVGGDNDDGPTLVFDPSLQSDKEVVNINGSGVNDTLQLGNNETNLIKSPTFVTLDTIVFGFNNSINLANISNTNDFATIVTDAGSPDSMAATENRTCWHDKKAEKVSCVKNNSNTVEVARQKVLGDNKLHNQQDGSDNKTANPCRDRQNGGCQQICIADGAVAQCECRDGLILKGTECVPPEPCSNCSKPKISDICWVRELEKTFVFSGEVRGNLTKKNRARYTVKDVKIFYGRLLLKEKKLYKKNKSLRVWIKIPVCCPTIKKGQTYLFVGKMNADNQVVIPTHGQVMKWKKKKELGVKKVCNISHR